jgi:hypothetical protein
MCSDDDDKGDSIDDNDDCDDNDGSRDTYNFGDDIDDVNGDTDYNFAIDNKGNIEVTDDNGDNNGNTNDNGDIGDNEIIKCRDPPLRTCGNA